MTMVCGVSLKTGVPAIAAALLSAAFIICGAAGAAEAPAVEVVAAQGPFLSRPLADVAREDRAVPPETALAPRQAPGRSNDPRLAPADPSLGSSGAPDPLWEAQGGWEAALSGRAAVRAITPSRSFQGLTSNDNVTIGVGLLSPPDPVGDVGPNHYVQMVNEAVAVYNKSGVRVMGPVRIQSLWTAAGGNCATQGSGDPIVLYDRKADRWLLTEFTSSNDLCLAVSQTADPTGAYFLYQFANSVFPDYPKYGAWPDSTYNAYFLATNESNLGLFAFDRAALLAGAPTSYIKLTLGTSYNFMLPADLDGPNSPPAGTPGIFYTFHDGTFWGGVDRIDLYTYTPNFASPGSSAFTPLISIPITPFNYTVCGYFIFNCAPQPATAQKLDTISEWPMWRLQYRNFGSYESLVGNFTVEITGTPGGRAGIRWFELRKVGAGAWILHQEGTHSPDTDWRWVGSAAQDGLGNLALAYTVASTTTFPAIRMAHRLAADGLGVLQPESVIKMGGGSQTGSNRWGDYSSLNLDPIDDCTFWYTNEHYDSTSALGWVTHISSFALPGCTAASVSGNFPLPLLLGE